VLPNGRDGFLSLSIVPFVPGLLLMVTDVSAEGRIEQRVTQQRNELDLLAAQLTVERATLEDLFRRFVPKAVASRAIANPQAVHVSGERRVISVLFADMRGYTALMNEYEPAEFMALLNAHYAVLGNVIGTRGGTLSQHAGDMLMALFNAPEEQPDHALRATQAALEARAALRVLQDNAQAKVQFGMAVNTGVAIVGYLGYEEQLDYSAIGDVTNVAARLSGLAQGEQVLLGPATHEAVRAQVATREFGSVQLKGHAQPLRVYETVEDFR
jgi:adenylate cyclase